MGHPPVTWLAGIACLATLACTPPFAKLDGIVVDARPALPGEFSRVQVIRQGKSSDGAPNMSIQKGDQLATATDGAAILTLRAGYEVIMEPGTEATIENPSIFVKIGTLIIKKLEEVKEALEVNTEFTSAGVEGTVFAYEVGRDNTVKISVLEGHVTVRSKQAHWDSVTYGPGDAGTIRAGAAPGRIQKLDPATASAIRQRIVEVEQAVRPEVPDVRGLREDAARAVLTRSGLRPGSVSKVITRRAPPGVVVNTIPPARTARRAGDRVSLQVEDSSLVVPKVVGLSFGDAVRQLQSAGFPTPDTTSSYAPDARIGTVLGAAPGDGAIVSATTRVMLTLARNIPDRPTTTDTTRHRGLCTVPNLIEQTEQGAVRLLIAAKLRAGKINHLDSGKTVSGPSRPPAGTAVKCGSPVDFDIGVTLIR